MLDTDTRRRIDTARDILVGKVPDPKSQVEQITIALIYKFMDDMDAESEEFGGVRKFFAGDFARYGWARLIRSGLGGQETLNLYAEAIARMPENPGIPLLFRDIFKNAYLPYRDPETLRAFLKVIDEFEYDHSERLGDAFEYLLSVLGSQGEAGQFRTPRHIIDFIVEIVDPRKDEVVLDPACGTAGFLISSYKHILRANTDAQGHSTLTPDEKGRLAQNFRGYDISPDMVRLSLVNMYLHGFADPHIDEYDTLTSVDRWNEYADVILANPPFMSPKGGIRPHNRFSVKSKRSEVLFVDYIAEHLTPNGRAGIIVPEGIIFQSQSAYKQLRKMLVEDCLVAVVSLPPGVFQPYSGVKTSILILDKSLARKADTIGFFKVENDGFDLGAQRRAIAANDLPQALAEVSEYLRRSRTGQCVQDLQPALGLIVDRGKLAENGDYNLNGERYRERVTLAAKYPMVPLRDMCDLVGGSTPSRQRESYWQNGTVKWISSKYIAERGTITGSELITEEAIEQTSTRIAPRNSTIIITRVSVGKYAIADDDYAINQDLTALISKDPEQLAPEFIHILAPHISAIVERGAQGIGVRGITRDFLAEVLIPLPSLSVQHQIVVEIEGYQKVIDGARAVVDNYRPRINIDPKWPTVELGKVSEAILTGPFGSSLHQSDYVVGGVPVINPQNIIDGAIIKNDAKTVSPETRERLKEFAVRTDDVIIARRGKMGRCAVISPEMTGWLCGTGCFVIRLTAQCDPRFVFFQISSPTVKAYLEERAVGVTMKNLNQAIIAGIPIPLPPLNTQQAIVAEIEAEQALVAGNRELIAHFEAKIQATLARIWGEDEAAPAEA